MGNVWPGQKTYEVNQLKLQKECKDNICKIDESMVKLLTSLDAMHATAKMLLGYLNISDGDTVTGGKLDMANQNIWECKAVAARLLMRMERIVCNERQDVVSSLKTFLHFVIFNAYDIFKTDSEGFNTLKLDEYSSDPNEWHCTEDHYIQIIQNERTLKEKNAVLQNEILDLKSRLKEEENKSRKRTEHVQNELTKLKAKMTGSQKQYNELKAKNDLQNKQLEKQEAVIKGLEKHKSSLLDEGSTLRSKCTDIEKQNDSLTFKLNQVTQEKEALDSTSQAMLTLKDKKITELNKENSSLSAAIKQKEESIAELKCKIEKTAEETEKETELQHKTYDSKLNEKDKYITELKKKLSNFEQHIRNKEDIITKYESEKTAITDENIKLHMRQTELSACLMNTEKDVEHLREKINEHNLEIQRLRIEIKDKSSDLLALREEMNRKEKDMQIIKKECDEKESEIIMLANQYEEKNNELIQIMSKKTIQVQIYGQRSMGWTAEIEKELIDSLNTEMMSVDDKLELSFFKVSRPSDVLPDIPLLLICVTISRLGTDVINATQGLSLAPNMALTIFHHKDEHALPNQASERVLTAKELRGAGGIFDMAFKSGMGIYSCDMNVNTISSLVTFIRRQAT